jgi:SAM-dependent methyltransferase
MDICQPPAQEQLENIFSMKYGSSGHYSWAPAMRKRFNYFNPDDYYEALIASLVQEDTLWLDIGCGRNIFPSNQLLARELADRCRLLVGVDPDETIRENPYVHEYQCITMDEYQDTREYDLITMRMVAEHVTDPPALLKSLARCTHTGSRIVIYTVNRYSPIPVITHFAPFRLHQPVKRWLWHTESKDTFPTAFRMNTRRRLQKLMSGSGFTEECFMRLDDCRTFGRFRPLLAAELTLQKICNGLGISYPENCLLGVYRKSP